MRPDGEYDEDYYEDEEIPIIPATLQAFKERFKSYNKMRKKCPENLVGPLYDCLYVEKNPNERRKLTQELIKDEWLGI
jgi:hypothetical protein